MVLNLRGSIDFDERMTYGKDTQRSAGVREEQNGMGGHGFVRWRPNTTPKGTVQVIDDEHIVFADLFSLKTRDNLQKNPKAAVTVVDMEKYKGYQFKGSAQLVHSGPVFDQVVEQLKKSPECSCPIPNMW